jgi:hypothetical protein
MSTPLEVSVGAVPPGHFTDEGQATEYAPPLVKMTVALQRTPLGTLENENVVFAVIVFVKQAAKDMFNTESEPSRALTPPHAPPAKVFTPLMNWLPVVVTTFRLDPLDSPSS